MLPDIESAIVYERCRADLAEWPKIESQLNLILEECTDGMRKVKRGSLIAVGSEKMRKAPLLREYIDALATGYEPQGIHVCLTEISLVGAAHEKGNWKSELLSDAAELVRSAMSQPKACWTRELYAQGPGSPALRSTD